MHSEYDYDSDDMPCVYCGNSAQPSMGPPGPVCVYCLYRDSETIVPQPITGVDCDFVADELDAYFSARKANYNKWLGVNQIGFGARYANRGNARFPSEDYPHVKQALEFLYQEFYKAWDIYPTTLYLQYLDAGRSVDKHRDPKADLYGTTIGWFGSQWLGSHNGGTLIVDGIPISTQPGYFVNLPCTNADTLEQGPYHWVTKVIQGRRYSIIFNYNK